MLAPHVVIATTLFFLLAAQLLLGFTPPLFIESTLLIIQSAPFVLEPTALRFAADALLVLLELAALVFKPAPLIFLAPLLLRQLTLFLGDPALVIALAALALLELALNLLFAATSLIPFPLPSVCPPLGFGAALWIEPAELERRRGLACDAYSVSAEPALARAGDPRVVVVAVVSYDWHTAAKIGSNVAADVARLEIEREEVRCSDEPPVVFRNVGVGRVAHRGPPNPAIAKAPIHPCRSPLGVRGPHPAVGPDPAAIVIGCPTECIGRHPDQSSVGIFPAAVAVRNIIGLRRNKHPTVGLVVVPRAVRIELIVKYVERRHSVASQRHGG